MNSIKFIKLGKVIERNTEQVTIEDNQTYKQVTVRLWGKGVQLRNEVKGHEIKSAKRFVVKPKQFIISKIDARNGASGLIPDELNGAVITADFLSFNCKVDFIIPEYLFWLSKTNWFIEQCVKASSGTTNRVRLNEKKFLEIEIPLPDIQQQKVVINKINNVVGIISKIDSELNEQSELVAELRRAILHQAVQGQVVEQEQNDTPALELLKEIEVEKKELLKNKLMKKPKSLPKVTCDEIPFKIPENWEWVRLGELVSKLGAGKTPLGGDKNYVSSGVKFIRSQNVWNEGLNTDDIAFISEEMNTSMAGSIVESNDILLNITGGSIGRSCLISSDFDIGNVNQHVAIIRLIDPKIRQYIHKCIISPLFQQEIMNVQVGVSREGLSMTKLAKFLIPLPPIEEQERIINKVEELMNVIQLLEQEVMSSRNDNTLLFQKVIQQTFQLDLLKEDIMV